MAVVETGQIRIRKDSGHSVLAIYEKVKVGHKHPIFKNVFQLYDAETKQPCGGWSASGIEEDFPTVEERK